MKAEKIVRQKIRTPDFTPGIKRTETGMHLCVEAPGTFCHLAIYETGKKQGVRIPFSPEERVGDLWMMELAGDDFSGLEYTIETEQGELPDPCGRIYTGHERWGDLKAALRPVRCRFPEETYDWEMDQPLKHPYDETILYRLHVRGFTRHTSSGTGERGTFRALTEKIPYLKELGITAVELMMPNEFQEVMMEDGADGNPYATGTPTGRLNYWGYGAGYLFAPKASYTSGKEKEPEREFKDLVKEFHKNDIEVLVELYFTGEESAALAQEAVRFWVYEYHVDGVHLSGFAPAELLASDPLLADTKLLAGSWDGVRVQKTAAAPKLRERRWHLGEYNEGFLIDMRRVLKGDEDQVGRLIYQTRRNPDAYGVINYMAATNGFTMMDMVSCEQKHNEANGENNRDGSDYNYTWNCGVEGTTRKKKIVQMRKKQLRNAFLLLFLSQGTPMFLAGDEFGNSQNGNNNAYCQDNEISWLNWHQLEANRDIYEFVKYMIAFRKAHPVFHLPVEPKNIDYLVCGHPDVSYHGVKTWCPEFENFRRQLGILYCGEYGRRADGTSDDYFFVAYNMHWEPHEFDLPKLPKGMQWTLCINTDDADNNGICPPESLEAGQEPQEELRQYMVPPRSILVFRGVKPISGPASEKNGKKAGKVVKSVKRQIVRKEPEKEAETVVAAAREL
ncbi:alpha-amylase [Clostridium sp.]|uniref:alpha-amylase n=1 Tax=Clostridium sp. TaxID=1506 RepID=UPI00307997DF